MARGPSTFKQRDLTRAIKAAVAAGLEVERAWIEVDGRIMLGFRGAVSNCPEFTATTPEVDTWADVA